MDDFFEKLRDGVVKGANVVADKSTHLVDLGKNKAAMLKLETQKADAIRELGTMFYEMVKNENLQIEALRGKCDEITAIDRQLAEKREEEGRIKSEL